MVFLIRKKYHQVLKYEEKLESNLASDNIIVRKKAELIVALREIRRKKRNAVIKKNIDENDANRRNAWSDADKVYFNI